MDENGTHCDTLTDDGNELVTLAQAAALLGKSTRTVLRYVKDNLLSPMTMGNVKYYQRPDVLALQARLSVRQTDRQNVVTASCLSGVSEPGLTELLKEQTAKLEAAAHRIGYLEAQLEETRRRNGELTKLLEAPKHSRWRFWRR